MSCIKGIRKFYARIFSRQIRSLRHIYTVVTILPWCLENLRTDYEFFFFANFYLKIGVPTYYCVNTTRAINSNGYSHYVIRTYVDHIIYLHIINIHNCVTVLNFRKAFTNLYIISCIMFLVLNIFVFFRF